MKKIHKELIFLALVFIPNIYLFMVYPNAEAQYKEYQKPSFYFDEQSHTLKTYMYSTENKWAYDYVRSLTILDFFGLLSFSTWVAYTSWKKGQKLEVVDEKEVKA